MRSFWICAEVELLESQIKNFHKEFRNVDLEVASWGI